MHSLFSKNWKLHKKKVIFFVLLALLFLKCENKAKIDEKNGHLLLKEKMWNGIMINVFLEVIEKLREIWVVIDTLEPYFVLNMSTLYKRSTIKFFSILDILIDKLNNNFNFYTDFAYNALLFHSLQC